MNDRELLELAAKAAGINHLAWCDGLEALAVFHAPTKIWPNGYWDEESQWSPLTDDGDALRLAVRLGISVNFWDGFKQVICRRHSDQENFELHGVVGYGEGAGKEPTTENVRRAIVRAAAAIGEAMQ